MVRVNKILIFKMVVFFLWIKLGKFIKILSRKVWNLWKVVE